MWITICLLFHKSSKLLFLLFRVRMLLTCTRNFSVLIKCRLIIVLRSSGRYGCLMSVTLVAWLFCCILSWVVLLRNIVNWIITWRLQNWWIIYSFKEVKNVIQSKSKFPTAVKFSCYAVALRSPVEFSDFMKKV